MKKAFFIPICGFLCFLLITSTFQKKFIYHELTVEEKVADFEYLYNILKDNYPYFEVNKRLTGFDWLSHKDEFLEKIKATKDNVEFYRAVSEILSYLNNDHTGIIPPEWFDGYRRAYDSIFLQAWKTVLNNNYVVTAYEYWKTLPELKRPRESHFEDDSFEYVNCECKILEENKIAYIKIKSFGTQYIKKDLEILHNFYQQIKNYSYLIIDIRGNGGGNTAYWTDYIVPSLIDKELVFETFVLYRGDEYSKAFIKSRGIKIFEINKLPKNKNYPPETFKEFKYFSKWEQVFKPKNSIYFKGKIFLLVDGDVYSASESFAVFCKATNWATLVGERTGGDGVGIDPFLLSLPNSGLVVRFSADMGLNPDGTSNEEYKTIPDIIIDKNEDALEKVLNLILSLNT